MNARDIAEFKENRHIVGLIAEFQRKLESCDPFFVSFDDVTAQVETHIIDVGVLGIEIVKTHAGAWSDESTIVNLYTKDGDDWMLCYGQNIDGFASIELGVWETIAAYRKKLERQARNEKKRKYRKGNPVTSVGELLDQEFVYWHDKIYAKGWFLGWQLRMAYNAVGRGEIYKAVRKDEADA